MAQQQDILAQEDARIGLQSTGGGRSMLRSRTPTAVFEALGAEDGEYFHWTVFADIQKALAHIPKGVGIAVGYIISEEDAKPRDIIAEKTGAKKSAKKGASKKGGVKVARKGHPVEDDDDPFAEDDDGSAPPQRRPIAVAATRKVAPAIAVARPVAVSSGRAPRVQGAIAKPGVARKGRGVRYRE